MNRSYQELAEYYGTAIVPARVEHPKDKSHAEGTVRFVSTWILAALRNEHFFTLREAKEAVRIKLEELNLRPFTAKDGCRKSAYVEEEQAFMRPLASRRYEVAMLADAEWNRRQSNKYLRCIHNARFAAHDATMEGIEYAGVDRNTHTARCYHFLYPV